MQNFTLSTYLKTKIIKASVFLLFSFVTLNAFAQTTPVDISVNWPNWSSENRVEVYNPSGTLLTTIDNGYNGASNNSYATSVSLGCVANGNNYYIIMYDTYGDGWNGGASNVTVSSNVSTLLTNSGASANPSGVTLYFNVNGSCIGTCSSTVSTFPYTEDFETDFGLWTQDTGDNFDWSRNSGGTTSNNTGPNNANGGSFYIYTEASSNFNNTSNLDSPCFDLSSATSAQFSFYYHMYGSGMGTLNVDLSTNSGLTFPTNLWSQSGQVQSNSSANWTLVTLDLSPYVGQTINLRLSGTTGSNYRSDMAIDDITLTAVTTAQPEIDILGNALSISNNDATPSTTDDTDFGSINVLSGSNTNTFTIQNIGSLPLNLTGSSPYVVISGANATDFTLSTIPNPNIPAGNNTSFDIIFDPSSNGIRTAIITIANNDSNENPYSFYIQGRGLATLTEGPGGVTANLELWLKANDGAGLTDNSPLTSWYDQANANDATVNTAGQEPTYRDNANYNVNFNPVVDFDSSYSLGPTDDDYSYDDTSGDFLEGTTGFYTQDIFAVVIPDTNINASFGNMDLFCGDEDQALDSEDVTGIGYGRYSARFTNEVFAYCVGSSTNTAPYPGYGVADNSTGTNYDNAGILNTRNHDLLPEQELYYNAIDVNTVENDLADFSNVNDSRYWIGRSEGYEAATDARIVEIISFSSRKSDTNLIDERNKIQSYLAVKYGITLGINGTSQDYVASDGTIIWNTLLNTGFNYDIAGIGRDDDSDLYQRQSKSVNNGSIVAFSLNNTELTNNLNTDTFNTSNEFLVWGNDGQNTNSSATSINVSLGPATVTTVTDVMNRKWKITETVGDDIGKVEVSIFETDFAGLPPLTGNDAYVMLVSDDSNFTTSLQTVFLDPSTFNGLATREGTYDFDGTKYFTFGVAHEEVRTRHLGFDGVDNFTLVGDKVDLAGSFTASAWIKPDGSNALNSNKTIVAKNNGVAGYKFFLTDSNVLSFSIGTLSANRIDSNTTLPDNIWHHVAVIYNGTSASLYIDGVLDNTKTIVSPTPNGAEFSIGAIYVDKTNVSDYFKGAIDEIRVWDDALNINQLRYVMNQELEKATAVVNGVVVPYSITKNEIASVNWNNLLAYYNMNSYIGTHLNDVSGNGNRGSLTDPDTFTLVYQSSPLPYTTTANGSWNDYSTWTNGTELYIPGSASIVDPNITIDWTIVRTSHDITIDNAVLPAINGDNRGVLGLFVDANKLTVNGDTAAGTGNGLTITHYLSIDGKIDLEGESQLIQTLDSDFNASSSGTLEKDQQGTQDLYTYNYWSSPVGATNNTTNNNSYTVPQIYNDGTNSAAPVNINFIAGSNGANGNPISIADYWIYKYGNLAPNYYNWEHIRSTGTLLAGEGFTMKGVNDTSNNLLLQQNYVLEGKPNNAEITLTIDAGNDYLVGNPYASAIDANRFILDNTNTTGAIYFWEHFGGGTHNTSGYQGGYATYNFSGGVPAIQYDYSTGGTDPTGGNGTKTPGRYIPVAQGFFISGVSSGTINFNNNQRVFQKEGSNSVFLKNSNNSSTFNPNGEVDNRLKIRLSYISANNYKRQILVTRDNHATALIDFGFDAENTDGLSRDMFWMVDTKKFTIQGTNEIEATTILPLGLKTDATGINTIKIEQLENVPTDLEIYIYDSVTNLYHDIRNSDFTIDLPTGNYLNRFEVRFNNGTLLSTDEFDDEASGIQFHFANDNESIVIHNPELQIIKSITLHNILGQSILKFDSIDTLDNIVLKTNNLSTGNYILNINTAIGNLSKKVVVE